MSNAKFQRDGLHLTRELLDYVQQTVVRERPEQLALREQTAERTDSRMMIAPEQGAMLAWILRLVQPRRVIEVGTFTGYSAMWLVEALQPGGTLVACDVNPETLEIARAAWRRAGIAHRVVPRLGPATETLKELLDGGWTGTVDAIFVDADKTSYAAYYDLGMQLLRPGGVMLFDNVLWSGKVADPEDQRPETVALREVSRRAAADPEAHATIFTDGDGVLAVQKLALAAGSRGGGDGVNT